MAAANWQKLQDWRRQNWPGGVGGFFTLCGLMLLFDNPDDVRELLALVAELRLRGSGGVEACDRRPEDGQRVLNSTQAGLSVGSGA